MHSVHMRLKNNSYAHYYYMECHVWHLCVKFLASMGLDEGRQTHTQQDVMINQCANNESHTLYQQIGCNLFVYADKLNI